MPPSGCTPSDGRGVTPVVPGRATRRRLLPLLGALAAGGLRPAVAQAQLAAAALPTAVDLRVIARALSFLDRPPNGPVELGLIFNEAGGAGQAAATALAEATPPIAIGALLLTPRPVALAALRQTRVGACLLLEPTPQHARLLAEAVAGRQTLTVTTDRPLVNAGLIVMAVRSLPRVEIIVSRSAAQASGLGFAPAFRMLIQEY
jgi:hypothetical protein